MTVDDLTKKVGEYNKEGVKDVVNAYEYAKELHDGQQRDSGEPYIIHPLTVAYILAEMHADTDTLCAGLLHDTLEDVEGLRKEEIAALFNEDVADLVDGVTKIRKLNFSARAKRSEIDAEIERRKLANTRKIITGLTSDARIIIIKLADRLHNMRTMEYKRREKQIENSEETMKIFVPLAYYLGAYRIKTELEDLAFKYINPEKYKEIEYIMDSLKEENERCLEKCASTLLNTFYDHNDIPLELKARTKNIYGVYKRMEENQWVSEIHDLLSLKIMVKDIEACYKTLGLIHSVYHPINDKIKDFIYNPKTNMYQSLHTTIFGPEGRLIQTQIRTPDMDKVASFGLSAYWDIYGKNARDAMQENLRNKYQFYESLVEINNSSTDDKEFVQLIEKELFADQVYVYINEGERIELPKGSTIVDLAYKINAHTGNTMSYAMVNGHPADPSYVLKNKDIVKIFTNNMSYGPREEWNNNAKTILARKRIKEFNGK